MHNPVSVLNNETHELLWDFDKQTDHLISTRPYNNQQKKKKKKKKKKNLAKLWTLLSRLTIE